MAGGIITFDLATNVGWAHYEPGAKSPESSYFTLPSTGDDIGRFMSAFEREAQVMIDEIKPSLIVYEPPFVGRKTSQATATKLFGLAAFLNFAARRADKTAIFKSSIPRVRKHFLGEHPMAKTKGMSDAEKKIARAALRKHIKASVILCCQRKGWAPRNDDEADALAILDWAAWNQREFIKVPWDCSPAAGPLFTAIAPAAGEPVRVIGEAKLNKIANNVMRLFPDDKK